MVLGIALAACSAGSAGIACSGGSSSSSGGLPNADGGASGTSGTSGASGTSGGPTPGSSSGEPAETVSCEVATEQASCAIDAVVARDVTLTTDASCKTTLYLTGSPTGSITQLVARRYTLKSLSPCAFERDTSFEDAEAGAVIAADDAGDVLTVLDGKAIVLRGGKRVTCAGSLPSDVDTETAVLARDGSVGYLGHYGYENSKPVDLSISKVTFAADGCSVAPLPLTGDPLTGIGGIALDTKGRLHVSDSTYVPPSNDRVAIFAADGTFVQSYVAGESAGFFAPQSITGCRGGICVDGFGRVVSFDENGVMRGFADIRPSRSITAHWYLGTPRGPLFLVGDANDEPRVLVVDILKQP